MTVNFNRDGVKNANTWLVPYSIFLAKLSFQSKPQEWIQTSSGFYFISNKSFFGLLKTTHKLLLNVFNGIQGTYLNENRLRRSMHENDKLWMTSLDFLNNLAFSNKVGFIFRPKSFFVLAKRKTRVVTLSFYVLLRVTAFEQRDKTWKPMSPRERLFLSESIETFLRNHNKDIGKF